MPKLDLRSSTAMKNLSGDFIELKSANFVWAAPVSSPTGYADWRYLVTVAGSNGGVAIQELEAYADLSMTTNLFANTEGGTSSASSSFSGSFDADNAFDEGTGVWASDTAAPAWVARSLPAPVLPLVFVVTSRSGGFSDQAGRECQIEYSEDGGVTWIPYIIFDTQPVWGEVESRTFYGVPFTGAVYPQFKAATAVLQPTAVNGLITHTLDLTSLSLVENDVVVINYARSSNTNRSLSMVSSGWNDVVTQYQSESDDLNFMTGWKRMGATPDTEVVVQSGSGADFDSISLFATAYTGVGTLVTNNVAQRNNTSRVGFNSILPDTAGSIIILAGGSGLGNGEATTYNNLGDLLNVQNYANTTGGIELTHATGHIEWNGKGTVVFDDWIQTVTNGGNSACSSLFLFLPE